MTLLTGWLLAICVILFIAAFVSFVFYTIERDQATFYEMIIEEYYNKIQELTKEVESRTQDLQRTDEYWLSHKNDQNTNFNHNL